MLVDGDRAARVDDHLGDDLAELVALQCHPPQSLRQRKGVFSRGHVADLAVTTGKELNPASLRPCECRRGGSQPHARSGRGKNGWEP